MNNIKRMVLAILCVLALCLTAWGAAAEPADFIGENAYGAGGVIRVQVTMDGDKIVKIKTLEQSETAGLGTTAIVQLTKTIVKANSLEVDSVSGATLTSISFKAAVRQAVETALGVDPTAGIELGENEYLGLSENALGGRLLIKATIADGVISAIDILEAYESSEVGIPALETMKQRIIEANSTEVDSISGATVTCKAICEAVHQAVESAAQ
ncbi:MAG: FMN-binding protein [Clostridia bacterium]|nr:FMN-binding protein [Clostridia bacterium]